MVAAVGAGALAEAIVFGVYLVGRRTASKVAVAKSGGILFFWFHHVGAVFTSAVGSAGVKANAAGSPMGPRVTVALAPMLGTALVALLLYRGGRDVASAGGGGGAERAAHGAKIAVPYALVCLAAAFGTRLTAVKLLPATSVLGVAGRAVSVHPSFVAAVLWPLALGVIFGAVGGFGSADTRRVPRPSPPRDRPSPATATGESNAEPTRRSTVPSFVHALVVGGGWMLVLALVLSVAGLLVLAAVQPHATASYFRGAFRRGPARGGVLVGLNVLALPNMAIWVAAAAMGACVRLSLGTVSGCVVSYSGFPRGTGVLRLFGLGASKGSPHPFISSRPSVPYLLFLLVPLAAAMLGGMRAARGGPFSTRLATGKAGGAAGVGFALWSLLALWVSEVVLTVAEAVGRSASSAGVVTLSLGPSVMTGALLALGWGVLGGALGGFVRGPPREIRG